MQRPLLLGEPAAGGEGAGDVGGIAAVLRPGIDQHQVGGADPVLVGDVMQHATVGAGPDDAAVGGLGAVAAEHVVQLGLQLVLVHARAHRPHHGGVRLDADRKSTRLNSSHVKISYAV